MIVKKIIHSALMTAIRPLFFVWNFASAIFRLLVNARYLYSADNIVLQRDGGFGYMAMFPDLIRRMYPGQNNVYLFSYWSDRHNPYAADIWEDPRFILIRTSFNPPKIGQTSWRPGTKALFGFIQWLLENCTPCKNIMDINLFYWAAVRTRHPDVAYDQIYHYEESNYLTTYQWTISYYDLMAKDIMPRLHLPEKFRRLAESEFKKISEEYPEKLDNRCTLYLREKGSGDSGLKSGSQLDDYLPAIRRLVSEGYQVLVYGDRRISKPILDEFKGALIDTSQTSIDPRLAMIYAATECDIFICDSGGATFLPLANRIPTLVINGFPFYSGIVNATNYFKTLKTDSGKLVPLQHLFTRYADVRDFQGLTLESNSAGEIEEAVSQFIEEYSGNGPYGVRLDDIIPDLPDYIWAAHPTVRISPAWLKKFGVYTEHDATENGRT